MLEHRFAELVASSGSVLAASESGAFLPCPLATFAPTQASHIQEIYRLAAERTREQLQPRRSFRIPSFSRN